VNALAEDAVAVAATALATWLLPALGMRALAPRLEHSRFVRSNYRGMPVFLGLGAVWAFWALGIWLVVLAGLGSETLRRLSLATRLQVLPLLIVLVFGALDDLFGSAEHRGFAGHLRSLARGHVTTGALKLGGIGLAATWASFSLVRHGPRLWSSAGGLAMVAAGALLIAGAANLVNLLDLRPGRAMKGYLLLTALACAAMIVGRATGTGATPTSSLELVAVTVAMVGPVAAAWRYDVSERGMLGDAGANVAGALAGIVLVGTLPLWGVVAGALAILALNLASERVSFSQVIASNRVLSWFDGLGRMRVGSNGPPPASGDHASGGGGNDG
jgi:UDP-GlcNAc:undecaprenyl-phosphate GlcNAc-1-phosphate transferase